MEIRKISLNFDFFLIFPLFFKKWNKLLLIFQGEKVILFSLRCAELLCHCFQFCTTKETKLFLIFLFFIIIVCSLSPVINCIAVGVDSRSLGVQKYNTKKSKLCKTDNEQTIEHNFSMILFYEKRASLRLRHKFGRRLSYWRIIINFFLSFVRSQKQQIYVHKLFIFFVLSYVFEFRQEQTFVHAC